MKTLLKFLVVSALLVVFGLTMFPLGNFTQAGNEQTYIVLYKQQTVPEDASHTITEAGGELVYSYDQIGVAIARSESDTFRQEIMRDKMVENASSTSNFGVKLDDDFALEEFDEGAAIDLGTTSSDFDDPLTYLQWDMFQIQVPEAHAVTMGSPSVVVGDIDSGIDPYHPDLAANIDWARSVSCIGGVPNQDPAAWEDNNGHGTHTAGTIAAAANGIGIIGVAPDVKIAAIKGCTDAGWCWPEDIVCSFMWAGDHDIDVTNNSYYVDPYEFNCHNDPEQHAIWKAVQRAVRYAQSQGVVVVSSTGNSNVDLTHHEEEGITNACNDLPVELAGVIGVSANGNLMQKSYYSSYGVGAVDVVAPGGDARFQLTEAAPNGRVLSTIPTKYGSYGWGQGTSMASPHAAGVAALIISQYGEMPPGRVQALINQTADPQECPVEFNPGPPFFWPAECQGGEGYNSFYGHGQVNAYNAVTHKAGN